MNPLQNRRILPLDDMPPIHEAFSYSASHDLRTPLSIMNAGTHRSDYARGSSCVAP
ncbi:hypothetical protein POHY109586_04440 [Polaromonas hydrogenivorans]